MDVTRPTTLTACGQEVTSESSSTEIIVVCCNELAGEPNISESYSRSVDTALGAEDHDWDDGHEWAVARRKSGADRKGGVGKRRVGA
ncbi:hypothetical protein J6590_084383 [Homalodisca vitripennis]|nr:hypothetical protein J6590_084383 [Homalodisca vitripennis]